MTRKNKQLPQVHSIKKKKSRKQNIGYSYQVTMWKGQEEKSSSTSSSRAGFLCSTRLKTVHMSSLYDITIMFLRMSTALLVKKIFTRIRIVGEALWKLSVPNVSLRYNHILVLKRMPLAIMTNQALLALVHQMLMFGFSCAICKLNSSRPSNLPYQKLQMNMRERSKTVWN